MNKLMNQCFSEPRDPSHRRGGKGCLAESPILRPQRRLKITMSPVESKFTAPSLPGQKQSSPALCVAQ